jgi:Tfp pilus assembly protein PilO
MRSLFERAARMQHWQINALGAATCSGLLALWYLAGFSPLSEARAARRVQDLELTEKREAVEHHARVQAGWKASLEHASSEGPQVRLRPATDVLDQVAALSRAAAEAGLTLDEVKPGQAVGKERFATLPLHMSGTGAFPGFEAFLHRVRTSFPDTGVVAFEIKGEPEHADKPASFSVDLRWYASKLPAQPAQTAPAPQK